YEFFTLLEFRRVLFRSWKLGPFEMWDAMGVARTVQRMKDEGETAPKWVEEMLDSGRDTFYSRVEEGPTVFTPAAKVEKVEEDPRSEERRGGKGHRLCES